jgi:hypothetical protein
MQVVQSKVWRAHAEDENAATTEKLEESLGAEQLSGLGI